MNYTSFHKRFLIIISLFVFGSSLLAQDNVIEEVFVTAEKRSESLQDISQAVTSIKSVWSANGEAIKIPSM